MHGGDVDAVIDATRRRLGEVGRQGAQHVRHARGDRQAQKVEETLQEPLLTDDVERIVVGLRLPGRRRHGQRSAHCRALRRGRLRDARIEARIVSDGADAREDAVR